MAEDDKINYAEYIAELRLIDDVMMTCCFDGNIEAAQLLLRITLNKPDLIVLLVTTQKLIKNLHGRSLWLDIYAKDGENEYDVEIQRADSGASPKRARYHSSMMDANALNPKDKFSNLHETYVIFITENDVLGMGLPIYRIDRTILETGAAFGDGSHIVYVNGECQDETPLGQLMHDFFCTDPKEMHYKELAESVRYHKEDEQGVKEMGSIMEKFRKDVTEIAERNTKIHFAKKAIAEGKFSHEEIADLCELPLRDVEILAGKKSA